MNLPDSSGQTVLHRVAQSGSEDLLKLLLERDVEVNQHNHEGQTALHKAVISESTNKIKLLLDAGFNVNHLDNYGQSPGHYYLSERKANIDVVVLVLKSGVDVNLCDKSGKTMLDYTCLYHRVHTTILLKKITF